MQSLLVNLLTTDYLPTQVNIASGASTIISTGFAVLPPFTGSSVAIDASADGTNLYVAECDTGRGASVVRVRAETGTNPLGEGATHCKIVPTPCPDLLSQIDISTGENTTIAAGLHLLAVPLPASKVLHIAQTAYCVAQAA